MNKTFKVIFNQVLGRHVVVSEIASNIQRGACKAVAVLLAAGVLALPQAVLAGSPYLAPDQSQVTNDSGLDVYTVPGTTHQYTGDNAGIDVQLTQNAANGANVVVAGVSNMGTYTEGGKILLYQVESGSTGLGSVYYGEIETVEGIYKYTAVEKNGILYTNLAKARAAGVDVDSLTAQGYKVGVVKPTGGTISTAIQSASKPTSVTFGVRTQKTDTGYFQTQTITKKVSGTMNATAEKDVTSEAVVQTGDVVTASVSENGNDLTISINGEETTFSPVHYYHVNSTITGEGSNYNNDGATGLDALAAGPNAKAAGASSIAIGNGAQATGDGAIAIGEGSTGQLIASGEHSYVHGFTAQAKGPDATAWGILTQAGQNKADREATWQMLSEMDHAGEPGEKAEYGIGTTAWGQYNKAYGTDATAFGEGNIAYGIHSTAFGTENVTYGRASTAWGENNEASGYDSTAFGQRTVASNYQATAFGSGTTASGQASTAFGVSTTASGFMGATAFGMMTTASGSLATAFGSGTTASGAYSTAFGANTTASNNYATAFGASNTASGQAATAFGNATQATGNMATAFGARTTASGSSSTAFGVNNTASAQASTAFGNLTTASGVMSTSFGQYTEASGKGATAWGIGTADEKVTASGEAATAFGKSTIASGEGATAFGSKSEASGNYSTAFGRESKAYGENSLAALGGTTGEAGTTDTDKAGTTGRAADGSAAATGKGAVAIGEGALAKKDYTYAIGQNAQALSENTIAIGNNVSVEGEKSLAIGYGHQVKGEGNAVIGDPDTVTGANNQVLANNSTVTGDSNVAIGNGVTVEADDGVAVGSGSQVSVDGGVALGKGSVASTDAGEAGYDPDTESASTDTSSTWKSTAAAVSVGDAGSDVTRQITGVAAGTKDTDAVNVAQLKKAGSNIEFNGDTGATISKPKRLNVIGGITDESRLTTEDNIGVVSDGKDSLKVRLAKDIKGVDTVTVNKSVTVGSTKIEDSKVTVGDTVIDSSSVTTKTVNATDVKADTVTANSFHAGDNIFNSSGFQAGDVAMTKDGFKVKNGPSMTKSGISAGGKKITNVAAGTAPTDAVNVSQLNDATQQHEKDFRRLMHKDAQLERKIHRTGAHAAALAALHPLDFDEDHKWTASAGVGAYHGSNAVAAGVFYRPDENKMFSLGVSLNESDSMVNAGFSYRFGSGSENKTSPNSYGEMKRQVSTLSEENRSLSAELSSTSERLASADREIASLKGEIAQIKRMLMKGGKRK